MNNDYILKLAAEFPFFLREFWGASAARVVPVYGDLTSKKLGVAGDEVGEAGLYNWAFEWFINRNGMGQVRGKRWMEENGHDSAKQQKIADEVRKCYA